MRSRLAATLSIIIFLFSCKPDIPKENNQINQAPVKTTIENEEEKIVIPPTFTTEEINQLHTAFPIFEFDTLHLWTSDETDTSQKYFGNSIDNEHAKLFEKLFDPHYTPPLIIGRFPINKTKEAFIFRTSGWNCLCQIDLWLFDHDKKQFTDTVEVAFSEGDAGSFVHFESWSFDIDKDGTKEFVIRTYHSDQEIMGPVNEKEFRKEWQKVEIKRLPAKDCPEPDPKEGCRKFIGEKIEMYKLKGDKLEIDKSITPEYNKFKFHQNIQF